MASCYHTSGISKTKICVPDSESTTHALLYQCCNPEYIGTVVDRQWKCQQFLDRSYWHVVTRLRLWPVILSGRRTRYMEGEQVIWQPSPRNANFKVPDIPALSPLTLISNIYVDFWVWSSALSPHAKSVPFVSRKGPSNKKEKAKGRDEKLPDSISLTQMHFSNCRS